MQRVLAIILGLLSYIATDAAAQRVSSPAPLISLSANGVTAVLDTLSGRFGALHSDGRSILWASEYNLTSHVSVRIGSRLFANFRWAMLGRDPRVSDLGKGRAETLADRLRYTWDIRIAEGDFRLTQELIPSVEGSWREVRVRLLLENRNAAPLTACAAMVLDADAAGDDYVPLRMAGRQLDRETQYEGTAVPAEWLAASGVFDPDSVGGRIQGRGLSTPSVFIAGRWESHGSLGTAACGYRARDTELHDAAVYLEWPARMLAAGDSMDVLGAVGLKRAPALAIGTFGKRFYLPDPSPVYLVSDTLAHVTMSSKRDDICEGYFTQNDRWDTTVTVSPGRPTLVYMFPLHWAEQNDKSLRGALMESFLSSDKDIGVYAQLIYGNPSYVTCLPSTRGDTLFYLPGILGGGGYKISAKDSSVTIDVAAADIERYYVAIDKFRSDAQGGGTPFREYLACGTSMRLNPLRSTTKLWYVPSTWSDGAGTRMHSNHPVSANLHLSNSLIGSPVNLDTIRSDAQQLRGCAVQGSGDTGHRFFANPLTDSGNVRSTYLLRVVSFEQENELRFDGRVVRHFINAGEVFDTLIGSPVQIDAGKHVAVYQSAMNWQWSGTDTMQIGGVLPLPPFERWGSKYYALSGSMYDSLTYMKGTPRQLLSAIMPLSGAFWIRIVTRRGDEDLVRRNGVPIAPSLFRKHGAYSWLDIAVPPLDYSIVESTEPILVITYGGYKRWDYGQIGTNMNTVGYSSIPPYKSLLELANSGTPLKRDSDLSSLTKSAFWRESNPKEEQKDASAKDYALLDATPNPFAASTTVSFVLPEATHVRLAVYDGLGREVAVLADAEYGSGTHTATFAAQSLPSGMYLCTIQAGTFSSTIKIVLAR